MTETETARPIVHLTEDQWDFIKGQELRRTEAANQAHREAVRLMAAQATCMNLQETRRMEEKRDMFAAQALIGLIPIIGAPEDGPDNLWDESIADRSYSIADAMLKARLDHSEESPW